MSSYLLLQDDKERFILVFKQNMGRIMNALAHAPNEGMELSELCMETCIDRRNIYPYLKMLARKKRIEVVDKAWVAQDDGNFESISGRFVFLRKPAIDKTSYQIIRKHPEAEIPEKFRGEELDNETS